MLFVKKHFIYAMTIQTGKADSVSTKYQIMVISMLNNWNRRYSSYFLIKFVGYMSIYYSINLDIVSSYGF